LAVQKSAENVTSVDTRSASMRFSAQKKSAWGTILLL